MGDCVVLTTANQSRGSLQHVDHVFPLVSVSAGIGVADCPWLHGVVVQHHIVRRTVLAADQHVSLPPVQFGVVTNHGGLSGSVSAVIPRTAALRCDQRVNLDAVDITVPAVVQSVMVYVGWYENGIASFDRILFVVAEQCAAALYDIDLVLPFVNVV